MRLFEFLKIFQNREKKLPLRQRTTLKNKSQPDMLGLTYFALIYNLFISLAKEARLQRRFHNFTFLNFESTLCVEHFNSFRSIFLVTNF